jgi:hypothetical protein
MWVKLRIGEWGFQKRVHRGHREHGEEVRKLNAELERRKK